MQPEPAHRALAYIGRLCGVERAAQELADRASLVSESARRDWHDRRRELRQAESRSILAEFYDWLREAQWQVLPTRADQDRFIDCPVQFQANRLKTFFPSEWHREHQIVDVKADLLKVAGRVPGGVAI